MKTLLFSLVVPMLLTFFIVGCATRDNHRFTQYDINCSSCSMKVKYDVDVGDENLEIKGF